LPDDFEFSRNDSTAAAAYVKTGRKSGRGPGDARRRGAGRDIAANLKVMAPTEQQASLAEMFAVREHESRLQFLYSVVRDTQDTIRFLDTKAGFCVTLLTAMMAVSFGPLSHGLHGGPAHHALQAAFGVTTLFTLAMCLRVIFPTIHLQGKFSSSGPASPAFFLPHRRNRSVVRAIWAAGTNPLAISHDDYLADVLKSNDADLVRSMCDEVIVVSAIRQLKADRLHVAIVSLFLVVTLFFAQLVV
jgi:hypothetical protein